MRITIKSIFPSWFVLHVSCIYYYEMRCVYDSTEELSLTALVEEHADF